MREYSWIMIYLPSYDYIEFGEFVSIDRPINTIPTDILDDTLYISPANEYWIPLLIGAIKVLLSDRNWQAAPPNVLAEMTGQIDDFVSNWKPIDGLIATPPLNWHPIMSYQGASFGYELQSADFLQYYNNFGFKVYAFSFIRNVLSQESLIEISFRDNFNAACGISILEFSVSCSSPLGQVLIVVVDCTDMPHAYVGAPTWNLADAVPGGMAIKSVTLTTSEDMLSVFWVGYGLLVCGEA